MMPLQKLVEDNSIKETSESQAQKQAGGQREVSRGSPLQACHTSNLAATAASTNALRASSGLP